MKPFLLTLALALPATAAFAESFTAGALVIDTPYAFETPPAAMAGAGYLSITNTGDTADRLVSVQTAFPKTGLHLSETTDGVASMRPVEAIEIAPGDTVTLAPGGLHIMFMGLRGTPLVEGTQFEATLEFEAAGAVPVQFEIVARGAEMGHGENHDQGHGHGN